MNKLVISSLDEMFEALIDGSSLDENTNIKLGKDLNIEIKLEGEVWTGYVDYRIAEFVISLQKNVIKIYNDFYDTNFTFASLPSNKNLVVTVKVEKGCSLINIDLDRFYDGIVQGFKDMESRHKLIVFTTAIVVGFGGYFSYSSYIKYSETLNKKIEANKIIEMSKLERQKLLDLQKTFVQIGENSKSPPMYSLAKNMNNDDIVYVNGHEYTRKTALGTFRYIEKEDETIEKTFYIYDSFVIANADFKKRELRLEINSISFKASPKGLPNNDKKILYDEYYLADNAGYPPAIELLISITLKNGKIVNPAEIITVRKNKNGAITFKEAFKATE